MLLVLLLFAVMLMITFAAPTRERQLDDPEWIGEICVDTEDLPILERAKTI